MELSLEELAALLLDLDEATTLAGQIGRDMGLESPPAPATIKRAAWEGRLVTVKKGRFYLTTANYVREYMAQFDPRNRTGQRTIKDPTAATRTRRFRERKRQKGSLNSFKIEDASELE